jgi:hypothetical protein
MGMRWMAAGLLLAVAGAAPGQAQFDPKAPLDVATLMLARVRLAADLEFRRLPNCTCTMNVERSRRVGGRGRFELLDQLRLEVALVDGREAYSWPGARQFSDRELVDIVGGGAIGSGEFAGHARNVVLGGNVQLKYQGEEELAGRKVHRFDYEVPMAQSRYMMRVGRETEAVGYRGSFWADAGTFQLRRLLVEIFEAPLNIPLEQGVIRIDYEKREVGGQMVLLPEASESGMVTRGGLETRNRTTYTGCRLYTGESSLVFDEPEEEEAAALARVVEWELPKGLKVTLRLGGGMRMETLAVGDEVEWEVAKDAQQNREIWLAKGAKVKMRVALQRCAETPVTACVLGVIPERFEWGNRAGEMRAEMEEPALETMLRILGQAARGVGVALQLKKEQIPEGASLLLFRGRQLNPNFQTVWRTLEVPGAQDP